MHVPIDRPEPKSPSSIEQILFAAVREPGSPEPSVGDFFGARRVPVLQAGNRSRLTSAHQARRRRALIAGETASRTSLTAVRPQKCNGGNGPALGEDERERLAAPDGRPVPLAIPWPGRPQRKAPNHSRIGARKIFTNAQRGRGGNIFLGRCRGIPRQTSH